MQISGKRLHHYLCTACRHEELLFCSQPGTANDIPFPPGSLLGGRQDHILFRLCEMQLEAPPQPAGASVKRSEGKKKKTSPLSSSVLTLKSWAIFCPPQRAFNQDLCLVIRGRKTLTQLVGLSLCVPGSKVFVRNFHWPKHFVSLSLPDDCLN